MSESNTPYTPGGTPSINTDVDPSRLLPQLQQHFPRGINDPKVYSALAAVARQQQHETQAKATPTQLTPAQWGAVAAQHIQRQNKQRSQLQQTPTQQTPSNQTPKSTGIPTISTVRVLSATSGSIANSYSYLWLPANVFRTQVNSKRRQQEPVVISEMCGFLIGVD